MLTMMLRCAEFEGSFFFVLNQLLDIPLHAARLAMAAAACRCPSLSLTRKITAFFLRYTPFLPPDQLARS